MKVKRNNIPARLAAWAKMILNLMERLGSLSFIFDVITFTPLGVNQLHGTESIEFGSKHPDIHFQGVGFGIKIVSPYLLEEGFP